MRKTAALSGRHRPASPFARSCPRTLVSAPLAVRQSESGSLALASRRLRPLAGVHSSQASPFRKLRLCATLGFPQSLYCPAAGEVLADGVFGGAVLGGAVLGGAVLGDAVFGGAVSGSSALVLRGEKSLEVLGGDTLGGIALGGELLKGGLPSQKSAPTRSPSGRLPKPSRPRFRDGAQGVRAAASVN